MNRFVILSHSVPPAHPARSDHWDLMFEVDGALRTWAVADYPWMHDAIIAAAQLPLHRLVYLEFEGALSGNRGSVRQCEQGLYELIESGERTWRARLAGRHLQGVVCLTCQLPGPEWSLVWHAGRAANQIH